MSSPVFEEATRRRLTPQQAETVGKLTAAAAEVLDESGFDGLTVRLVAKRAGVAPATAYTYFSSKSHLVAELFWRKLVDGVHEPDPEADRLTRVTTVLRQLALLVEDEGQLAGAVTSALLGADPDVAHLRLRVGGFIRSRVVQALGTSPSESDDELVEALEMLYSGALVRAGMGYETYAHIADRLVAAATRLLDG
ncbi:TetR/AcrR family transcriptional regulator [Rhodococcus sp. HNM0569]|uniref:TetR/AcrR family transcriptional regulator n=1 Tax=Rhodococcus sp. HNM0569 TaxID=2716340 RepID=UPI00146C868F|nr:TetR/AcrR family transcriptional regulator [Rhodococcus sp. HNM0569]NLU82991.1 TetR/AcrR family transcriptional regulator [Rhodococcus sp. HNM0569]